jgi:hypothetical protein
MELDPALTETEVTYDVAFRHEGKWILHGWSDIPTLEDALELTLPLIREGVETRIIKKTTTP